MADRVDLGATMSLLAAATEASVDVVVSAKIPLVDGHTSPCRRKLATQARAATDSLRPRPAAPDHDSTARVSASDAVHNRTIPIPDSVLGALRSSATPHRWQPAAPRPPPHTSSS